jgi:hypothetical protein
MNVQFKLVKEDKDLILIENINHIIKIYLYNNKTEIAIKIYYKQSCTNKTFYKSKYVNFIPKKYYNAGMIVFSKEHKNLFLDRKNLVDHYIDQTYLNMNIILNNYNCEDLGYKFNFYRAFDRTYTKDHNLMYRKRTVENFKNNLYN